MNRVSRSEYINIPNKTLKLGLHNFSLDKLSTPTLKIWPAPENSTDILVFNKIVRWMMQINLQILWICHLDFFPVLQLV